jgi:hypothetical protein
MEAVILSKLGLGELQLVVALDDKANAHVSVVSDVAPGKDRVAEPSFVLVAGRPCVGFAHVLEERRTAHLQDPELQFAQELLEHDRDTRSVRWRAPDNASPAHTLTQRTRSRELGLSDDVDTHYHLAGGGFVGNIPEFTGRAQFVPAIPEAASMLTVHWSDLRFPVPLR